jgi:hypothetical protein
MWKLVSLVLLVGLVGGQETVNSTIQSTAITGNSSVSTTNATQNVVLGDKKEIVTNTTVNLAADAGSAGNPFTDQDLADDQSLGSFKYYFILLAVSSLSVISLIIYKAMR